MNAKQTVPLIATLAPAIATVAPVIIIGGAIFFTLKWIFSDDEKKPETVPANSEAEIQRKDTESTAFRHIPAEIPVKSVSVPVSAPPTPIKKKFVTREDLATVFNHGTRSINRTAAVTALRKLGFGRTAAYAALTPDGRFSTWLHFAPDGIITWTE
jgi:hypothetical protein